MKRIKLFGAITASIALCGWTPAEVEKFRNENCPPQTIQQYNPHNLTPGEIVKHILGKKEVIVVEVPDYEYKASRFFHYDEKEQTEVACIIDKWFTIKTSPETTVQKVFAFELLR